MREKTAATACNQDIRKFCANVSGGDGGISNCLREHVGELRDNCSAALSAAIDDGLAASLPD